MQICAAKDRGEPALTKKGDSSWPSQAARCGMLQGLPPASPSGPGFSYINKRKIIRGGGGGEGIIPRMCCTGRVSEGWEAAGFGKRQREFIHRSRTVPRLPARSGLLWFEPSQGRCRRWYLAVGARAARGMKRARPRLSLLRHIPEGRGAAGEPKAPSAGQHGLMLLAELADFCFCPEACSGFLPQEVFDDYM